MSNVFTRGLRPRFEEMRRLEMMSPRWIHRLGYYGLALLFVAAAAALRWALPEVLGPTPFLVFYLAWVGAATFGGLGPGLLATAASWLCLEVLFNFTPGQTVFSDPTEVGRFLALMAGGLTVSLVAERMRRGRIHEREQARALASARRALERERDILQAVMDGAKNSHLVYLDRDFNFVQVNAAYAQTCGYRPEQMIGKNHFALYPHAENEAIFARVRDTGEPFEIHDKPFEFPDQPQRGVTYWDWTLTPIKDPAGQVEGLIFSLHETTERKRAEEAMQQANEQLQQQAEELQTQGEELQTQTEELRMQTGELAHANAALHDAEERLRLAMESGRVGVWEWEVGTKNAKWSQGVYMLLDCTPGAVPLTQEAFRQRIHPQDLARQDQALKDSLERCEDYRCEFRVVWTDGSVHWIEARGQYAYVDEGNGKILWMRGVLSDIDRRKQAEGAIQQANEQLQQQAEELQTQTEELQTQTEELAHANAALRESEERERRRAEELATFLEAAPTPVIIVHDPNGAHMTGNRAANELLRHGRGAEISLSAPPETKPRHFKAVKEGRELRLDELPAQRAARGEQVRDFEFSLVFDDGTTRHLLGYGTPLRDEEGRPRGAVHILVDITERKRAEEALRELNATLESKVAQRTAQLQQRARQLQRLTLEVSQAEDRERKRMAEILHDDLQQIIAAAKFHLTVLRNRVKADASVQAIGAQIDQMLKEAVEKSRGLSHELSPAVLHHDDLTETLGWLASQMQAKHGLVVHVHAHGPAHVPSDGIRTFLYKTAQELLFNVVKHARVKEARIQVRRRGPCVCLSVSDRGRGFDPQGLREAAGFGLLSIRERIELLGGRMKIRSAPGKGSTFFVVVPDSLESEDTVGVGPRAYPTSATPGDHGGKEGDHGGSCLRVLLADDHRIVREGLRSLLSEEPDVEIVGEAAHGREAVDLALQLQPDVVIMDVSMPLIDGNEATRQIKTHLPKTRVIALSTYNAPETIAKMYQAGAEGYVLKTASSEELLAAIRSKESSP